jgi:nitrogen-specific signal transduction histidine kinase/CheY-like chemotaxis protein
MGMIATELTERKRVEEERRRIEAQFRHAQKLESLGVLAGGIAHDFNNILAAILGHADLASELNREEPAEAAHHLEQVIAAARRAAELTNQMLAYAGRASFRVESLDLNKSILEISDLVTVSLPKKIALELRLAPEAIWVRGDPAQVSQVVMNLVTNAAQAIGDGSGVVSISTERSTPPDGRRARLVVRDTGCGMASETVERIFDPFFTTKEGGRGLGLAAVMGIVRGLDGTLDVESRLGVGTTFRLSFPIDGASRSAAHDEPAPTVGEPGTGTVLVVDDEDAVRQFTSKALERLGYEVIQAEDGLDALAVWQSHGSAIDAVVLDMSMPGMGGREVFEHLRRHAPGLPVLFTSGYDPSDAAGALLRETSVAFLQKPYRPGTLGQELSKLLGAVQAA